MKLTVKLFLGAMAFVAIASTLFAVNDSSRAASGSIFVTNSGTTYTNESPAPAGRIATGTVYVTTSDRSGAVIREGADTVTVRAYAPGANVRTDQTTPDSLYFDDGGTPASAIDGDNNNVNGLHEYVRASTTAKAGDNSAVSILAGAHPNLSAPNTTIAAAADVDDCDVAIVDNAGDGAATVAATDGTLVMQVFDDCFSGVAGTTVVAQLGGSNTAPIVGTLAEVQANTEINVYALDGNYDATGDVFDANATGVVSITGFFAGNGGNQSPWISFQINVGDADGYLIDEVVYETSIIDILPVTVTSELTASGASVKAWAEETGRNTGIFETKVQVLANDGSNVDADASLPNVREAASKINGVVDAGETAKIRSTSGPVTFKFDDGTTSVNRTTNAVTCTVASGSCPVQSTTVSLDTIAPQITLTSPANGTYTQSHSATFTGTFSDEVSGLRTDSLALTYDRIGDNAVPYTYGADDGNTEIVVATEDATDAADDVLISNDADMVTLNPVVSGLSHGVTSVPFSLDAATLLPQNNQYGAVEASIGFMAVAWDVAGNVTISDSSSATSGYQENVLNIDTLAPAITPSSATTGKKNAADGLSEVDSTATAAIRNTIRLTFSDALTDVDASDFLVTLDSGATLTPASVSFANDAVAGGKSRVYLTLGQDLVSNDTPKVKIVGSLSDKAGNTLTTGEIEAVDAIPPLLTVTLSGGTGGDRLTKGALTVTVTSDENLTAAVTIDSKTGGNAAVDSEALSQGGLTWSKVLDMSGQTAGVHYFKVASSAVGGSTEVGTYVVADATADMKVTLDKGIASTTWTVSGSAITNNNTAAATATTTQVRPVVQFEFDDPSVITLGSITVTKAGGSATSIASEVVKASSGQKWYWVPSSDLAAGSVYTVTFPALSLTDSSGNTQENAVRTLAITISAQDKFSVSTFAGWNAVSFPSDPVDSDLNAVFDNASHDSVLAFDSSVPGQWRVSVRDTATGKLVGATENGLTSVSSMHAYWVHSINFDPIKVMLSGANSAVAGAPPSVVSFPVSKGFAAIPVLDPTRRTVSGNSGAAIQRVSAVDGTTNIAVTVKDYLASTSYGRVYKYNAASLRFEEALDSMGVKSGDVLFVEFRADGTVLP